MFFSYMDTPFLPIPSPWAVRDSDTDISADCAKWCCKPRSSLDIAILVFRMLLLFLSTWIIIIGIWISQMPVSSGHTMGEVAAMLSLVVIPHRQSTTVLTMVVDRVV
jgi:hypothetical protein